MKKAFAISVMLALFAGCNTDIVTTSQLKTIKNKCVYVTPIESQDPYVGKVLRDVLEKEFIRKHIQLCDADTANVILTGSTFMTTRAKGETSMLNLLGGKQSSAQAIESVTITAKDKAGNLLLTASYNNVDQQTASKLAQDFGSTLADKLR
jgi:ethanolamine utilization protein EutA (predicted chaperonin)